MFDLRWVRENGDALDRGLARRGLEPRSGEVLDLDRQWREAQATLQDLQSQRNEISREIGQVKKAGGDAEPLVARVGEIKTQMQTLEEETRRLHEALDAALSVIPNIPDEDVPDGPDESGNAEVRRVGSPPRLDDARDHVALGEALGLLDMETAARLSGSRFAMLTGALARLERALGQFMIDVHTTEFGYTEVAPPVLVRDAALYGTGQLPKFADDLFRTTSDHWLIPTAEVPLTNIVGEQIIEGERLPQRFAALTPCFRQEAGAAGRDTRGILRQHQFWKVELVSVTAAEQSAEEHERMTSAAETVLQRLDLPYRVVSLCTGDIGFAARKTYDIEVWLPGQSCYREISSCSNTGEFQARRMNARYRFKGEKSTRFVHTLNGSGVAVGRALIAVMETYQTSDGGISIPDCLRAYMNGLERIEPNV